MEDKTYGIKTHLVEQFRELQISRRKSTMVFVGNCTLLNSAPIRATVEAGNGIISITPFPLFGGGLVGYRIPPQRLSLIIPNYISILLHPALMIHLLFDTDAQKYEFVGQLNLPENESSDASASHTPTPLHKSAHQTLVFKMFKQNE
ncbi:hypothetical protein MTP99_013586 [Tenebrio molitor]|nr:hypothetical protein MTP99_013586 [Tenebrio molitor]